jgi:hypothetical protein
MYKICYKTEVWQSAYFVDREALDKAIDLIEDGKFDDIFDPDIGFLEVGFLDDNMLFDTNRVLSPHENNNQPTIEAYFDNDIIWWNE